MNNVNSLKGWLKTAVMILLISFCNGEDADSTLSVNGSTQFSKFRSAEEYVSHTKGSAKCVTSQCHASFTADKKFIHRPAATEKCSECHTAEAYPGKFGLMSDQRTTCARCHKAMEHEIVSSKSIHGPIKNGDCTSCHDPHASNHPSLLRQSYNTLCISCHKLPGFYGKSFLHTPAKDGNCGICHDPHASNFKARLVDAGFNLCITCHDTMVTGMTEKHIHEPILKSGCSDCHDPHSGTDKLRLKKPINEICFSCHEEKKIEVEQYVKKHKPAVEGRCTACHSPHYSGTKHLLKDKSDSLCYNCHKAEGAWKERRFKHGPVVQGNCTACHNPHGSDNAFILRLPFPHKFYSEYEKGKYSLCFLCHIESLVTAETAESITKFRNGDVNLHRLHVKQKKGRTCRACHDVHASNQEGRIRDSFPFGSFEMPMIYSKTKTGGSCVPGCHREKAYDRLKTIDNGWKTTSSNTKDTGRRALVKKGREKP